MSGPTMRLAQHMVKQLILGVLLAVNAVLWLT